nr:GTx2-1-2 [Grammostola rosea]
MKAFFVILGLALLCAYSFALEEQDQLSLRNDLLTVMFAENSELIPETEERYCQKWMWTCDEERKCCEGLVCRLWCKKKIEW